VVLIRIAGAGVNRADCPQRMGRRPLRTGNGNNREFSVGLLQAGNREEADRENQAIEVPCGLAADATIINHRSRSCEAAEIERIRKSREALARFYELLQRLNLRYRQAG